MAIDGFALEALADPDADARSDSRLVRQLIEGSQDALAGLYDRHAQAVLATALRVSGDRGMAEEVVQETFLTLWNRAELFDASRGALPAWLLAIARNRAIDRLRAAGRHERASAFSSFGRDETDDQSTAEWLTATGELIGVAGPEPGPERALADKETRESIKDALSSLAPLERRVIELAYETGLSQSEIAAHLGWPIGTVKTRTRRGLRHLRDWIEGTQTDGRTDSTTLVTGQREPQTWPAAASSARSAPITSPCINPC